MSGEDVFHFFSTFLCIIDGAGGHREADLIVARFIAQVVNLGTQPEGRGLDSGKRKQVRSGISKPRSRQAPNEAPMMALFSRSPMTGYFFSIKGMNSSVKKSR